MDENGETNTEIALELGDAATEVLMAPRPSEIEDHIAGLNLASEPGPPLPV